MSRGQKRSTTSGLWYFSVQDRCVPNTRTALLRAARAEADAETVYNEESKCLKATFTIQHAVRYGECLRIVGSCAELGQWKPEKGLVMSWSDGNVWSGSIELHDQKQIEFKAVIWRDKSDGEVIWEGGDNHSVSLPVDGGVDIHMTWEKTRVDVQHYCDDILERKDELPLVDDTIPVKQKMVEQQMDTGGKLESEKWSGKDTVFMQQNRHPTERNGIWDVHGLHGPALRFVEGDEKAGRCVYAFS